MIKSTAGAHAAEAVRGAEMSRLADTGRTQESIRFQGLVRMLRGAMELTALWGKGDSPKERFSFNRTGRCSWDAAEYAADCHA